MTALAATRSTAQYGDGVAPPRMGIPVKGATKIWAGSMVAVNASGLAVPASADATLTVVGRAESTVDNTLGADSALTVEVNRGVFYWDNADAVQADVTTLVYAVDDHTVSGDPLNGTRPAAGRLIALDSGLGAAVSCGLDFADQGETAANARTVVAIPIPALSTIANAGVPVRFTPGFAGRIVSVSEQVTTPATTAAKLATLTPNIAGVPITGGVLALTSANQTPAGANVPASAITGLNTFTAAQEITLVASAVTAFIEGAGVVLVTLAPL